MARWRRLRRAGSRLLLGATIGTACGALLILAPTLVAFLTPLGVTWFVLMRSGNRFS